MFIKNMNNFIFRRFKKTKNELNTIFRRKRWLLWSVEKITNWGYGLLITHFGSSQLNLILPTLLSILDAKHFQFWYEH